MKLSQTTAPTRPRWRRDDGAVAIEFALVLPILVVLVFGIVTFGLLFNRQQGLNAAAREGARLAVIPATTSSDIEARVDDSLAGSAPDSGRIILIGDGTDDDAFGAYYDEAAADQWNSDGRDADVSTLPDADDTASPCGGRIGETVTVQVWVHVDVDFPAPFVADDTWLDGRGEFRCEG